MSASGPIDSERVELAQALPDGLECVPVGGVDLLDGEVGLSCRVLTAEGPRP
jgi:hypothetical protein